MILKTSLVPLVVRDQERALRFYTEQLGFEKRQDYQQPGQPRWLTVAPKGQELEFILVPGEHAPSHPKPESDSGGNHTVFLTDDCQQEFELLRSRGVKFKDSAPVDAPWGTAAYFTDPDGNHLTLLQPKAHSWK
jgi:catechol 2,3-dioxygenase-like lactoylglutathione lyase family enzyme